MSVGFRRADDLTCGHESPFCGLDFDVCSDEHVSVHRVTPQAIQELFDELEASRQSRCRAWDVLQKIRAVLNEESGTRIAQAAHKTFDAEGELITTALQGVLRDRQIALRELAQAGRSYKECVIVESIAAGDLRKDLDVDQFIWELMGIYLNHHASRRFMRNRDAKMRAKKAFQGLVERSTSVGFKRVVKAR
jgi:hypothetical protein